MNDITCFGSRSIFYLTLHHPLRDVPLLESGVRIGVAVPEPDPLGAAHPEPVERVRVIPHGWDNGRRVDNRAPEVLFRRTYIMHGDDY